MTDLGFILLILLRIFILLLIVRIVIEMIQSFSRSFRPPRAFYLVAEPIFRVTDPPLKFLRRLIPPLNMGGVALDLSVIVLFLICSLLWQLIWMTFI
ncbi:MULTISPECIES: YggT family protein [unclassified Corynebacterium]|uniref:YggT family protein n=1 Tax=unclassified Corynebacterium TaxID=2624378 RepID=UPI0029C9DDFF|nr:MULTISPECIES: YggT family protein [unclassified Corynebacterium]WPF65434.1 YggT family protein [Corynebacterium sp. 22KM0430]WPF67930.1 YggT family protein [Corynebacterium sp. 21KM1197]